MDIANLTLTGLVAFGAVNVVDMFFPLADSRLKYGLSFLAAFAITFIPDNLGSILLQNAKLALEASLTVSAAYKFTKQLGSK